MKEEFIYNKIKVLNTEQGLIFGLACFYRTKHFYSSFEKNNDLSIVDSRIGNGNFLDYLESILNSLNQNDLSPNFFNYNLELFELGIVDDDYFGSSVENFSAQLVATIACDILEYRQTFDSEKLNDCVDSILEIINQNRSDLFHNRFPEMSDSEMYNYVDKYYKIELEFQNKIIEMLQKGINQEQMIEFCNQNQLVFK